MLSQCTCLSAVQVHVHVINPLALSNNELYGSFDEGTHEWQDGVLARIMRTVCKDDSPDQKWILFDGPVDTLWIESMNTLLDDNKLLTLLSGERISMTPQVMTLQSASGQLRCLSAAGFRGLCCRGRRAPAVSLLLNVSALQAVLPSTF